jgi:hypothetical protein
MANNNISIEEMVSSAFISLDVNDTRDELVFREWCYDALREIGTGNVDIHTVCLPVEDLCVSKPCDFASEYEINILDSAGNVHYYQSSQTGIRESQTNRNNGSGSVSTENHNEYGISTIVLSETDDSFNLSSNALRAGISSMELTYYRLPIDEDGNPLIREIYKLAVMAYIEYKYIKRERNRKRKEIPMSEVDWYKNAWMSEMIKVKGRVKMPSPVQADTIMRKWVTLVPNFRDSVRHRKGRYRHSRRHY